MNKINPFPVTSDIDELKNNTKIIQKEHFKNNINDKNLYIEDDNLNKKGSDKVKCMICGNYYTRYNKYNHNKTKHHKFCDNMNKKWRNMIIN